MGDNDSVIILFVVTKIAKVYSHLFEGVYLHVIAKSYLLPGYLRIVSLHNPRRIIDRYHYYDKSHWSLYL